MQRGDHLAAAVRTPFASITAPASPGSNSKATRRRRGINSWAGSTRLAAVSQARRFLRRRGSCATAGSANIPQAARTSISPFQCRKCAAFTDREVIAVALVPELKVRYIWEKGPVRGYGCATTAALSGRRAAVFQATVHAVELVPHRLRLGPAARHIDRIECLQKLAARLSPIVSDQIDLYKALFV
jgi:hypothetical protein